MGSEASESCTLFYCCIQGLLKSWTALQLAVSHSLAGPHSKEKAQWLVGVIETFFKENANLEVFEVEEFLAEIMSNEFNILTEDNSINEICVKLCDLFNLWSKGEHDKMKEIIRKLPCVNLGDCIFRAEQEDNIELDADKNIDDLSKVAHKDLSVNHVSNTTSKVNKADEDGWIQVSNKKRHQ